MEHEPARVTCYSGRTYAERPTSFYWKGQEHRVKRVESEWQEPGERHFRLRTEDDRTFDLCYDENADMWLVREWAVNSTKGGGDEQRGP